MKLGYASITLCVLGTKQYTCTQKYATKEKLHTVIKANLDALNNILDYNYKNNLRLFRISSDIIPFGSSPVNTLNWQEIFKNEFEHLAKKIKKYDIRISMHPGQYTILNSENNDIVNRAIEDLIYHNKVLTSLGADYSNKIILHIGGKYENKYQAIKRFIYNFKKLPIDIKNKIIIENDDVNYNVSDCLYIADKLNIPIVLDVFHNSINPSPMPQSNEYWIKQCKHLWTTKDGNMKIHYSQQYKDLKIGTHSKNILIMPFMEFYQSIKHLDVDIMLEVKDKNISAIKCLNSINNDYNGFLKDFKKYKFNILEKSLNDYNNITTKIIKGCSIPLLYLEIENCLKNTNYDNFEYTVMYIKKIMKNLLTKQQIDKFDKLYLRYKKQKATKTTVKNFIYRTSIELKLPQIYNSYYF